MSQSETSSSESTKKQSPIKQGITAVVFVAILAVAVMYFPRLSIAVGVLFALLAAVVKLMPIPMLLSTIIGVLTVKERIFPSYGGVASPEARALFTWIGSVPPFQSVRAARKSLGTKIFAPADGVTKGRIKVSEAQIQFKCATGEHKVQSVVVDAAKDVNPESKTYVFWLHGGGFIAGKADVYANTLAAWLETVPAVGIIPDYTLAPEASIRHMTEEAVASYQWLIRDLKVDPSRIVFAGDSAGGGLALLTLIAIRDRNIPLPAGCFLSSPFVDFTLANAMINAETDPSVSSHFVKLLQTTDLTHGEDRKVSSPINMNLEKLPPMYIVYSDIERVAVENRELIEKLTSAGVKVTAEHEYPLMVHCYTQFYSWIPEAAATMSRVAKFVQQHIRAK